jgi:hypothetical protein
VLAQASTASFRIVAYMPAVLLIVFGLVWLNDRRKGGFKPETLVIGRSRLPDQATLSGAELHCLAPAACLEPIKP